MSLFKQRRNKSFNYQPRYQKDQKDQTDNNREDVESKLREARHSVKRKGSFLSSLPLLIILFIMVLILMYVLEGYIN